MNLYQPDKMSTNHAAICTTEGDMQMMSVFGCESSHKRDNLKEFRQFYYLINKVLQRHMGAHDWKAKESKVGQNRGSQALFTDRIRDTSLG
jgi:hypothetical protein